MRRLETLKMWKLTEALDLSEDQAAAFFPLMKDLRNQKEELEDERGALMEELIEEMESDADTGKISNIMDRMIELKQQECENDVEFIERTRSILSTTQQAKYVIFEGEFQKRMMQLIRDFHKGKKGREKMDNPWDRP